MQKLKIYAFLTLLLLINSLVFSQISISGPTSLCIGQTATYTATATNGPITTWNWASNPSGTMTNQVNAASTSNVDFSFSTAGTYTVGVAANSGTSGTASVVVTVAANLTPAVAIGPSGPCAATSTTLTATPTNGGTAPTYQWSINGNPSGTGATLTTSTLAAGDVITCVMTSNSSCASPTTANSNTLTAINCVTNPTPSITSATLSGCVNQPISLSGSASPSNGSVSTWAWTSVPTTGSFSAASNPNTQFTPTAPGSYTITLTVTPGGATATTTLSIASVPTLSVTPAADTVCIGGSSGTTLTAVGSATTFSWSPAAGLSATTGASVVATPTTTTTYTVVGTANGCSTNATSLITALPIKPVIASTLNNNYICLGSSDTLTASAPSAQSYSWTPSTGLSCTNCPNPIVTVLDTTTYTLTVTGNCFTNYSDTVTVFGVICGPPVAGFSPSSHKICRYECIQYTDTSIYSPLQYQWYFQGGIPDSSHERNPRVCYNVESANSPAGNGMYYTTLIVTNILGQKDTIVDSIKVQISPVANINNNASYVTIELGTSTTLSATPYTSGALYYSWTPAAGISCPTCPSIEVAPQQNTIYIVKATNGLGCSDYDTILVRVEKICGEVFVPSAFSPNGDNINDNAVFKNNDCIRSVVFSVFDRWGEKVFFTEDPKSKGWDGNYKGTPMDAGVFVYYLDAVLKDNTTVSLKGNITLVR